KTSRTACRIRMTCSRAARASTRSRSAGADTDSPRTRRKALATCAGARSSRRGETMTATRATEVTLSSDVVAIAKVCHEANRAWSDHLGDEPQPKWEDATDWQRSSTIHGVEFHWS